MQTASSDLCSGSRSHLFLESPITAAALVCSAFLQKLPRVLNMFQQILNATNGYTVCSQAKVKVIYGTDNNFC